MARVVNTPIQKRFSDVDSFQHVNNVSQQMYFDVGKMDFYNQILGDDVLLGSLRIVTVATSTSYISQIHFTDQVRVETSCERVGNKSIILWQRILCGEELRSESRSTMVAFDFDAQQGVAVPETWRERMLRD